MPPPLRCPWRNDTILVQFDFGKIELPTGGSARVAVVDVRMHPFAV